MAKGTWLALITLLFGFAASAPAQLSMDTKWMSTTWRADDREFKAVRMRIQALADKTQELDKEVATARRKCQSKNPTIVDAFWWACAVSQRASGDFDYSQKLERGGEGRKVLDMLARFSKPESYEYTREKFLMVTYSEFPTHNMVTMAEALHKRDPSDRAVALTLLYLYSPSAPRRFPKDRAKGEALVKHIDSHFPKTLGTWSKTSWFYYCCWLASKSKADAMESIRRLTEARKLTKSAEQRRLIDEGIAKLRKGTPGLGV